MAQVNAKVQEENVFLIFAVTEENVQLYERLSANIEGSATRTLKDDSDNVVELVEQEYKVMFQTIRKNRSMGKMLLLKISFVPYLCTEFI